MPNGDAYKTNMRVSKYKIILKLFFDVMVSNKLYENFKILLQIILKCTNIYIIKIILEKYVINCRNIIIKITKMEEWRDDVFR